jgi:hypothetical protein
MKTLAVTFLLSSCAICQTAMRDPACGPQDTAFTVTREKTQHPTPSPEGGKAMLYVIGSSRFPGWGFWRTLAVDRASVGAVNHNRDYFLLPIDPGEHHLCAQFSTRTGPGLVPVFKIEQTKLYYLVATPGETYYLDLHVGSRFGFDLQLLDPGKGCRLLASSTFSASHPK